MKHASAKFGRRLFLKSSLLLVGLKESIAASLKTSESPQANKAFIHGVASGDPLTDRVIIWSRVTSPMQGVKMVDWEISTKRDFSGIIAKGKARTSQAKDYTIKVDVLNLQPDTYYYYRFKYNNAFSATGRTKTLPAANVTSSTLLAVSCNAYEGGFFNAYRKIAERPEKIDAVLHLGDYIYEDFLPQYFDIKERIPFPQKRCISLSDYRARYAQYREDSDLQKAHQMHPFIHIWDDHEIADDAYATGARNHDAGKDGDYMLRIKNAIQAFHEWVPIRSDRAPCNRNVSIGNLVDLFMLDERTERTEEQNVLDVHFDDTSREMIGQKQFQWLTNGLEKSGKQWKLIGTQVLFSPVNTAQVFPVVNERKIDNWSGYPVQQKALFEFIKLQSVKNTIFLAGDSHCSWAFNITDEAMLDTNAGNRSYAVEIGIPAVSSGTWGDRNAENKIKEWESTLYGDNQHMKYADLSNHGYVCLNFSKERLEINWMATSKKEAFSEKHLVAKQMIVKHNACQFST